MFFPVFYDNTIAIIRNNSSLEKSYKAAIYLSDGRVAYSDFTPETLRKRYYNLFNNERGI
ncbi:MAG: hypothetical protein FWF87_02900 [Synergistaceae bacterium]|nr:hypothetical protein [Synergistaceae bacterium]